MKARNNYHNDTNANNSSFYMQFKNEGFSNKEKNNKISNDMDQQQMLDYENREN